MWVPDAVENTERILNRHISTSTNALSYPWKANVNFARNERIWNMAGYNVETGEVLKPHVEWVTAEKAKKHLMAQRAVRTNGVWTFFDAHIFTYAPGPNFDPDQMQTNEIAIPEFSETPSDIKVTIKFSKLSSIDAAKKPQLALSEIRYLRKHLLLSQRGQFLLDTQYQARLALPWTCLVVVLIALPFGAASGRRNVFVGVASSIFICFAFFILSRFGLALGTGGYIPGWVAAWTPNFLFGTIGIFLTQRVR
jgi:lipopolysaccharide export LptBFGC system permease protein LptF